MGLKGEPGLGKVSLDQGRYWMFLSPCLMIAASWSRSVAARLPRPFFMLAQTPAAHAGARLPGLE